MIIFYIACVVVSILIYLILCITDKKKSLGQNIMILLMTISNIGYLSLALSKELAEAILSLKILYLGGCFLPMLYFFTVCEVCHVRLKTAWKVCCSLLQLSVYFFVCTVGFSDIYYQSVQFEIFNGIGRLEKVYGTTHFLYPLTMYGYFLIALFVVFLLFEKRKQLT